MDTFQIREELFFRAPCGEIGIPTQDGSKFEAGNPESKSSNVGAYAKQTYHLPHIK